MWTYILLFAGGTIVGGLLLYMIMRAKMKETEKKLSIAISQAVNKGIAPNPPSDDGNAPNTKSPAPPRTTAKTFDAPAASNATAGYN